MARLSIALAIIFTLFASVGIAQQGAVGYHVTKSYDLGGEGTASRSVTGSSPLPTGNVGIQAEAPSHGLLVPYYSGCIVPL
jgi:hypothetical protein